MRRSSLRSHILYIFDLVSDVFKQMPKKIQAQGLRELLANGSVLPEDFILIDLDSGPSPQYMSEDVDEGCCCGMRHYAVTDTALVKTTPACCCFGTQSEHYDLLQVQDIRERNCCGYLCSRADVSLRNGETVRIKCVDTKAFVKAIRPRIGRRRIQK